jgi:thymidylate synthase (FAD)
MIINDPYFKVRTISRTENPYSVTWTPAHGDYSEGFIGDEWDDDLWPNEEKAWKLIESQLLHSHRPHAGPLEHAHITIAVGGFPHDVMVQHRTHRLASFDVQSQRYTGNRVVEVAKGLREIESVFYFRPEGKYRDRLGNLFEYTQKIRNQDIYLTKLATDNYKIRIDQGMPPEQARHCLTQNVRQNYTFTCNIRSLLHFFNMRSAKDAQLEIQTLCEFLYSEFENWVPELATRYKTKYWGKSPLTF